MFCWLLYVFFQGINGKMSNVIKELSTNTAMGSGGACGATTGRKTVIIMDEVDGMSGSDRGGISDLIKIIAKAKVRHLAFLAGFASACVGD